MDNPTQPSINVIKPSSGKLNMPRFPQLNPKVIGILTVLLAIVSVITAILIYKNRNQPQVPTPANASASTVFSDNFDASAIDTSKWSVVPEGNQVGQAAAISNGKLVLSSPITIPYSYITLRSVATFSGDFDIEVDLSNPVFTNVAAGLNNFRIMYTGQQISSVEYNHTTDGDTVNFKTDGVEKAKVNLTTSPAKLRLLRVGDTIQAFYATTQGYQLIGSLSGASTDVGYIELQLGATNTEKVTSVSLDNFTAKVNLSNAPTPVQGSPEACLVSFTVLDLLPTNTPSPTPSGTPSPTVTPTRTPTPTITPTGTQSPTATPTLGPTVTGTLHPTPTATVTSSLTSTPTPTGPIAEAHTPTPVTLQTAGSTTGTWILALGGMILVGLGGLLFLAL
jgi:hypothetical protein